MGSYRERDIDEFMSEALFQDLLEFAKDEFIKTALRANEITTPQFTLGQIHSISTQVVAGMNVKFNVDLVDYMGEEINVTLVVFYQPWEQNKQLKSYTINQVTVDL